MTLATWQGGSASQTGRNSLLYSLVTGEEVVEGPLDPAAYAATDAPGVGGARLAAIDGNAGVEIITFDDPEVPFAGALGGNAVLSPLSPLVPEPGSATEAEQTKKAQVYTVQEGDTIASIAAQFNISVNTILWANGLSERSVIQASDHLTILPTTGVLHTVRNGDTVLAIAKTYDADPKAIIGYNRLGDDAKLSIGRKLIIPDGAVQAQKQAPTIQTSGSRIADETNQPEALSSTGEGLLWPTATRHISQYFRWGHTGVDIDNRSRPPVYAAEAGTVEFAGWLGGYGNLIIVNHGAGLSTYYAHLEKFYVAKGEKVGKGEALAKMGSTGRSTGPHLHFEVRRGGHPVNPLGFY